MEERLGVTWYLTFLPNGIASGIVSTLIPLYLVQGLNGSLVDLGTMTFASTALLIPASIYLGRLPDRYRRAKPFILASFLGVSLILFMMTLATSVLLFQVLFVLMELAGYLRGPSTSILIAESFERGRRSSIIARQGFTEGIGAVIGLGICTVMVNSIGYRTLLTVASPLVLASFVIALLAFHDPQLYIERFLDRYDRLVGNIETFSLHLTSQGTLAPSLDGRSGLGREPNMRLFGVGRAFFSFAASNAFTSLPIFLLSRANFQSSTIFTAFMIRSVFGAISFLIASRLVGVEGGRVVKLSTGFRMILVNLMPLVMFVQMPLSILVAAAILSLIAFSWSVYAIGVEMVTVSNAAPGSLGFYDALTGVGGALGAFMGGLIPTLFGFEILFVVSSGLFALALITFYTSLR